MAFVPAPSPTVVDQTTLMKKYLQFVAALTDTNTRELHLLTLLLDRNDLSCLKMQEESVEWYTSRNDPSFLKSIYKIKCKFSYELCFFVIAYVNKWLTWLDA